MKNKKIIASVLVLAISLTACVSCAKKEDAEETFVTKATEETTTATTEATTTTEAPVIDLLYDPNNPMAVNPVTGVQDMDPENEGNRSVAIVVNNCYAAMPQRGVSQADAIYEYETEGGQTRLLCLFADVNTVPEIGSLRSARVLSTDLAAGNNSIFIHYGRNARVPDHISEWDIDHIDGNNCSAGSYNSQNYADGYVTLSTGLFFWRDSTWLSQRAMEHTAVSDGAHIAEAIEYFGIDLQGEAPRLFNFVPDNSVDIANGQDCQQINVYFSATNDDALFTYDATTGLYTKEQYGQPHIDQTTGEQIAVTNIIVCYADIELWGGDNYTVDAELEDGGEGWYVSGGKVVPITWDKDSPNDLIVLYNEDGQEVEVNRGTSYICIVDDDYQDMTTITATLDAQG